MVLSRGKIKNKEDFFALQSPTMNGGAQVLLGKIV
jgi:hypothetical protein